MNKQYNYVDLSIFNIGSIKTNLRSTGSKYIIEYNVLNGLTLYETDDTNEYDFGRGIRCNYDVYIKEEDNISHYVDELGKSHSITNYETGYNHMQEVIVDEGTDEERTIKRGYLKSLGLKVVKEDNVYKIINGESTYKFTSTSSDTSKFLLSSIENSDGTSMLIQRDEEGRLAILLKKLLTNGTYYDEVIQITYSLNITITYTKFSKLLNVVTLSYLNGITGKELVGIVSKAEASANGTFYDYVVTRVAKTDLISKRIIIRDNKTELTQLVTFNDNNDIDSIKDIYDKTLTVTRDYSKTTLTDSNGKTVTYVFEGERLNHIVDEDNYVRTILLDKEDDNKLVSEFALDLKHPSTLGEILTYSTRSITGGGSAFTNIESPITNNIEEGVRLTTSHLRYSYIERYNVKGEKEFVRSILIYVKGTMLASGLFPKLNVSVKYYGTDGTLIEESETYKIEVTGQEDKYYMFSSYSKEDYEYFDICVKMADGLGDSSLLVHAFKNGQVGKTIIYDEITGRVNETIDSKDINTYSYNENGGLISINNTLSIYDKSEDENGVITEIITSSDGLGNTTKIIKVDGLLVEKTTSYLGDIVNKEEYTYFSGTNLVSTYKVNDVTYTFTLDDRFNVVGVTSSNGVVTTNEYNGVNELFPDSIKSITKKVGTLTKGKSTITETKVTGIDTTLTNLSTSSVLIDRDAYQRVRSVLMGNKYLAQIDYGNTSYPDVITRFNNVGYSLNSDGQVTQVVDIETSEVVGNLTYSDKLLTRMQGAEFDKRYTYDGNGKLKQIRSVTDNIILNKTRDKDNQVVGEEISVNGSKGFVEHNTNIEETVEINALQSFINNTTTLTYSTFYITREDVNWDSLYCSQYNTHIDNYYHGQATLINDCGISCIDLKDSRVSYSFSEKFNEFGLFIKFNEDVDEISLFDLYAYSENDHQITNLVTVKNNKLFTNVGSINNDIAFEKGKWYYVAFKSNGNRLGVYINGEERLYTNYNDHYYFQMVKMAYFLNKSIYVTGINFSKELLDEKDSKEIIERFEKMVNVSQTTKLDYNNLDDSTYIKTSTYIEDGNTLELITLHKNEVSTSGRRPINELEDDTNDVDKNYVYDEEKKCFVYNNSKQRLKYRINNTTNGTVMFNGKFAGASSLLSLTDDNNKEIMFLYINGEFKLSYNNNIYNASYILETGWHNFAITWSTSDSGLKFIVYIDGEKVLERDIDDIFEGLFKLLIWHGISYVEDLRLSSSALTSTQINANINRAKFNIEKDYNTSGNIISKTIYNKGNKLRETSFEYYSNNRLRLQSDETNQIFYEYDSFDNITRQVFNGVSTTYIYDELHRLVRCNGSNFTRQYLFDNKGNITRIIKENGQTNFIYDEYNRLREFGLGSITYPSTSSSYSDGSFMYPTTITKGNEVTSLTWTRGKLTQLVKTNSGSQVYRNIYTYDLSGLRVKKLSYDSSNVLTTYKYFYDEKGLLKGEVRIRNGSSLILKYYYDELDNLVSFSINGVMYFYLKDAKNEIYAIMNSSGNIIGTYSYDPYGNILSISDTSSNSPLVINPFRYKGYYYDEETQLFYCNSRYYSPELCRFISPDNVKYLNAKSINGLNLYAYCDNDPVNKFDPSGCLPEWIKIVTDLAAYAVSAIISTMVATAAVNIVSSLSPVPISGKQKFKIGLATFTATFSTLNNLTNALYFTFISDGESDLTSSSYRSGYISRWDRLDYAKKNSKESWYNINAWRYYSEYNAHMYAWYLLAPFYTGNDNDGFLSDLAHRASDAHILEDKFDPNPFVFFVTIFVGVLGI